MRPKKKQNFRNAVALVVDGEDEMWYMENVKRNYPSPSLKSMKISPEFPKHKKVEDLFSFAKRLISDDYSNVFLIVDMDNVLRDNREMDKFKCYYNLYQSVIGDKLTGKSKKKWEWMKKLIVVINTPCVEFWYLLHYGKTTKFYPDFDSMKADLKKNKGLEKYVKSGDYYNKIPDIYNRLGGDKGIITACNNAVAFKIENANTMGLSEMNKIFDYYAILDAQLSQI